MTGHSARDGSGEDQSGDDLPLAGRTVLVTADRRADEIRLALTRKGARVRHVPVMSIVSHVDDDRLVADTRRLVADPPELVVATSGIGFRGWLEAADAAGLAEPLAAALGNAKLIARGAKSRGAIQAAGLSVDWIAESETSAEVLDHLLSQDLAGRAVAIQHHGAGADDLDTQLADAGARVTSLVVYRWGPPPDPAAVHASVRDAAAGDIDAVVFTSAPGAHRWLEIAATQGVLDTVRERVTSAELVMATVGPVTAAPLEERGITALVPDRHRLGAMLRMLADYSWRPRSGRSSGGQRDRSAEPL